MIITLLKTKWFRAHAILPGGAIAYGYGMSFALAGNDCYKDILLIKELQNG